MRVGVDDRAASSIHEKMTEVFAVPAGAVHAKTSLTVQGTTLLLSTSRVPVCFIATLASLATAARGPLHIAGAKKHHILLAATNLPCAC